MLAQVYILPPWTSENNRKNVIKKTLEVPVGGNIFYFEIPDNPMVYVSEMNGVLYINGLSYWDSELYMFQDLKDEFVENVLTLAKAVNKEVVEANDILLSFDDKKTFREEKILFNTERWHRSRILL